MADDAVLVWYRSDLRTADHPALSAAVASGRPVVALYVLDDVTPALRPLGGAARWWLHGSLASLGGELARLGIPLLLRRGASEPVVAEVARSIGARTVTCSRAYDPGGRAIEEALHATLAKTGATFKRYPGMLLVEPEGLRTKTGGPYKVYTPFWRALVALGEPRQPIAAPKPVKAGTAAIVGETLDALGLLPVSPDWAGGLRATWTPGAKAAEAALDQFLATAVARYAEDRNRPDLPATSRLSPHLRSGEISPATCWHRAKAVAAATGGGTGLETFLKELVWREFSYHLLFHFPDLATQPFRKEFAAFPWAEDRAALAAWQRARTGYPIVDAGLRQLWRTGWMHNRVRMIVGSFLVKHLLIPWQAGEAWFWDTLVDADPASNAASWQWVAGSGADAAPYFRIFNPVKQGETFDPDGVYVRQWVPELARLRNSDLHQPWNAPPAMLAAAGVRLGETYPAPIVDHATARARALGAYETLRLAGTG